MVKIKEGSKQLLKGKSKVASLVGNRWVLERHWCKIARQNSRMVGERVCYNLGRGTNTATVRIPTRLGRCYRVAMHNKLKKVGGSSGPDFSTYFRFQYRQDAVPCNKSQWVSATRCNIANVKYKADQGNMSNRRKHNLSITKYKSWGVYSSQAPPKCVSTLMKGETLSEAATTPSTSWGN